MKNYIQEGENLTLPAPEDVLSGGPVLIGDNFGIGAGNALEDEDVDITTVGVFRMNKVVALGIVGDPIYYNDTTKLVSKTDTDIRVGVAMETVLSGVETIAVRLDGFIVTA